MNIEREPVNIFIKSRENLQMLTEALKSPRMDKEVVGILEKFFSLPFTPIESCYGHPERNISPYLSYVNDEVRNDYDKKKQELFRRKILELESVINGRIGNEVVKISFETTNHGNGPDDYTVRFKVSDEENLRVNGDKIIKIIWDEFASCLDEIR